MITKTLDIIKVSIYKITCDFFFKSHAQISQESTPAYVSLEIHLSKSLSLKSA